MIYMNGHFIPREEGKIDIEDRGFQFGDGVYEVIRVYNGKMFGAHEHIERLFESANKLHINYKENHTHLLAQMEELIKMNQLQDGIVYIQISRGTSLRSHAFPTGDIPLTVVAYTSKLIRPEQTLMNGAKCLLTEDIRWLRCDIKSVNLLGNVLAKQKAAENGCYEAIFHRGDIVTEGSSSNVFIIKDGVVKTHPANQFILNGITRRKIIEICNNHDIPFVEETFTKYQLLEADEVFITSTTSEVTPVIAIDKKIYNDEKPGEVTKTIQSLFLKEIEKECGTLS